MMRTRVWLLLFLGLNLVCTKDKNPMTGATDRVVINSLAATSVTDSSAVLGGEISSNGAGKIIQRGVCWSLATPPTLQDSVGIVNDTATRFYFGSKNLLPNKAYFVRAFAKNASGTIYGNIINFRTPQGLPRLTTVAASNISNTSAESGGVMVSDGGTTIIDKGICLSSIKALPSLTDTFVSAGTGSASFNATVSNLLGNKRYYIRAYARNSIGTTYASNVVQLLTSAPAAPTVSGVTVSNVTRTNAQFSGSVVSNQGALITEYGFVYGTTPNPTIANSRIRFSGNVSSPYNGTASSLSPGTTYYVRAYAYNSAGGPSYSPSSAPFNTQPIVVPTVLTSGSSAVTYTGATLSGSITDDGGGTILEKGFYYSSTGNPTTSSPFIPVTGGSTSNFSTVLSGLNPNTNYNFVAYAKNIAGTSSLTDVRTFKTLTPSPPTVSTIGSGSVTFNSAILQGNISSDGGSPITERGFYYSSTGNPTTSSPSIIATGTSLGLYMAPLSGLTPNTQYNYVAYAKNAYGTALSPTVLNFRTLSINPPTLTTSAVSGETSNSFQSGGNITADGGAPITRRGICWNTTGSPTIANSQTSDGSGLGSFASIAGSLASNTTYYVRAYAINSANIPGYGNQVTAVTTIAAPTLVSPANNATLGCCYRYFECTAVPGAVSYEFQFSKSSTFALAVSTLPVCGSGTLNATTVNRALSNTNSFCVGMGSSSNIGYWYWRVRAIAGSNISSWSATRVFYYPF